MARNAIWQRLHRRLSQNSGADPMTRLCIHYLPAVAVLIMLAGCGSVRVKDGEGSASAHFHGHMGAGDSGVILVDSGVDDTSLATRYFWGIMHVKRPEKTFAELFSYSAEKEVGLRISNAENEEEKINDARPVTDERFENQLQKALEQGHNFLFKAHIDSWHQNYILFFQWAKVDFELLCYSLHTGEVVWLAEARTRKWYATDRELLALALRKVFSSVKDNNSFSKRKLKKN